MTIKFFDEWQQTRSLLLSNVPSICYKTHSIQYYHISGNFSESKNLAFYKKKYEYQILAIFDNYIIKHIMSKRVILLAIHNFSKQKKLRKNNARILSSQKFLLVLLFVKMI